MFVLLLFYICVKFCGYQFYTVIIFYTAIQLGNHADEVKYEYLLNKKKRMVQQLSLPGF